MSRSDQVERLQLRIFQAGNVKATHKTCGAGIPTGDLASYKYLGRFRKVRHLEARSRFDADPVENCEVLLRLDPFEVSVARETPCYGLAHANDLDWKDAEDAGFGRDGRQLRGRSRSQYLYRLSRSHPRN